MIILFNNRFVSIKDAKVSAVSDTFLRGYGLFETLRTYNKKLFQARPHVDRLFGSAKFIGLKMRYSRTEILAMLKKVVAKARLNDQRLRILVINEGVIVTSEPLTIDTKVYKGVACETVKCYRSVPEIKSISYIGPYLSHEKAVKHGCFEAILTNASGYIFEGAYSNVFWFDGDRLCTRKHSVLPGITAELIMKNPIFKMKFDKITAGELCKKKEVFLTQTSTGIVPVIKVNGCKIGNGKVGEKTKKLMEYFFDKTKI